jgi:hypothetical protein
LPIAPAARASWKNRAVSSASFAISPRSTLTAKRRPTETWRAEYTTPMAPSPMARSIQ